MEVNVQLSSAAIALLISLEAAHPTIYVDDYGDMNIGVGHYMPQKKATPHLIQVVGDGRAANLKTLKLSSTEIIDLMMLDCGVKCKGLEKEVGHLDLAQHEKDALILFVFNIGMGSFEKKSGFKISNVRRYLLEKRPKIEIANQFKNFGRKDNKIERGLLKRRLVEAAVFLKDFDAVPKEYYKKFNVNIKEAESIFAIYLGAI